MVEQFQHLQFSCYVWRDVYVRLTSKIYPSRCQRTMTVISLRVVSFTRSPCYTMQQSNKVSWQFRHFCKSYSSTLRRLSLVSAAERIRQVTLQNSGVDANKKSFRKKPSLKYEAILFYDNKFKCRSQYLLLFL